MKYILVSSPLSIENEPAIIKQAISLGIEAFHLRKHGWGFEEVQNFLSHFNDEELSKIAVHGSLDWPMMIGLKRAHFKDSLRFIENQPTIFRDAASQLREEIDSVVLSRSFHSLDDLEDQAESYDISFLSPIFNSISKEGYDSGFEDSYEELSRRIKALSQKLSGSLQVAPQLYALGGISQETIPRAYEMGFNGVATLGSVWGAFDPMKELEKQVELCKSLI